jgi:hypothetical protein
MSPIHGPSLGRALETTGADVFKGSRRHKYTKAKNRDTKIRPKKKFNSKNPDLNAEKCIPRQKKKKKVPLRVVLKLQPQ